MKGPESVLFDEKGTMYVMTEDAKLLSLTVIIDIGTVNSVATSTAKVTEVMNLGNGRPLGGKFAKDGTLYIADTLLGLTRVRFGKGKQPMVEIVASRVKINEQWSPICYANDVDIGPKTGNVYFTDCEFSTKRIPYLLLLVIMNKKSHQELYVVLTIYEISLYPSVSN